VVEIGGYWFQASTDSPHKKKLTRPYLKNPQKNKKRKLGMVVHTCNLGNSGGRGFFCGKKHEPLSENKLKPKGLGAWNLPSKLEVLSSNLSTANKKKKLGLLPGPS
jgi:hypothetical protein